MGQREEGQHDQEGEERFGEEETGVDGKGQVKRAAGRRESSDRSPLGVEATEQVDEDDRRQTQRHLRDPDRLGDRAEEAKGGGQRDDIEGRTEPDALVEKAEAAPIGEDRRRRVILSLVADPLGVGRDPPDEDAKRQCQQEDRRQPRIGQERAQRGRRPKRAGGRGRRRGAYMKRRRPRWLVRDRPGRVFLLPWRCAGHRAARRARPAAIAAR